MAKNFAALYSSTNDSSSLEQSIFIKEETSRGQLIAPTATDFVYTLAGSALDYSQPIESSPHLSGRHHNDIIKSKKELSWKLPLLFNIDTSLGAAAATEIDLGVRLLYKSLLGRESATSGAVYDTVTQPSITFSLFENGDKWAKQAYGCFVDGATLTFPGDGLSQAEFRGMGGAAYLIGIGKSTIDNDGGNTVTLQVGEGKRFQVGGLVMIIEADGTTRSADTAAARLITGVAGDMVSLGGAPLADADGSGSPIYLCYYEPSTKTGISNPQTGLVGSFSVVGLANQCTRNATITIENAHEPVNYCFGKDALHGAFFVAANRMTATLSLEMNVNDDTVEFYNSIQAFEPQDVELILGDATTRHLKIEMPKVIFSVPSISVPETGSIPVTFEGIAYQSALDAADEITISFV